jgi:hypothetical protein
LRLGPAIWYAGRRLAQLELVVRYSADDCKYLQIESPVPEPKVLLVASVVPSVHLLLLY